LSNRRLGLLLGLYVVVALGYAYFATVQGWKYWSPFSEPRLSLFAAVHGGRILLAAAFGAALVYRRAGRALEKDSGTPGGRDVTRIALLSVSIALAVLVGVVPLHPIMEWSTFVGFKLVYLHQPPTQTITWLWLGALLADILLPRR